MAAEQEVETAGASQKGIIRGLSEVRVQLGAHRPRVVLDGPEFEHEVEQQAGIAVDGEEFPEDIAEVAVALLEAEQKDQPAPGLGGVGVGRRRLAEGVLGLGRPALPDRQLAHQRPGRGPGGVVLTHLEERRSGFRHAVPTGQQGRQHDAGLAVVGSAVEVAVEPLLGLGPALPGDRLADRCHVSLGRLPAGPYGPGRQPEDRSGSHADDHPPAAAPRSRLRHQTLPPASAHRCDCRPRGLIASILRSDATSRPDAVTDWGRNRASLS